MAYNYLGQAFFRREGEYLHELGGVEVRVVEEGGTGMRRLESAQKEGQGVCKASCHHHTWKKIQEHRYAADIDLERCCEHSDAERPLDEEER